MRGYGLCRMSRRDVQGGVFRRGVLEGILRGYGSYSGGVFRGCSGGVFRGY